MELIDQTPALFTKEPDYEVFDKYHFIPAIDAIIKITTYG